MSGPPRQYHQQERKPEGMLPVSMLEELSQDPATAVRKEKTMLHLALSPGALGGSLKQGLECVMMENLNRYYPQLGSILLGWDKLRLLNRRGDIVADSPYIHVDVEGYVFLFNPEIGSKILGKVIKKTTGHIGCLVHETFNVSLLCDKRQFNMIQLNEMLVIRVSNLIWDHRRRPLLHGRLDGDVEPDYDSGIDSTINGQQETDPEPESQANGPSNDMNPDTATPSSSQSKKNKKRKREADDSSEIPSQNTSLETSKSESEGTSKKKKKKRKKESE